MRKQAQGGEARYPGPHSKQHSQGCSLRQSDVRLSLLGSGSPTVMCNRRDPRRVWVPAPCAGFRVVEVRPGQERWGDGDASPTLRLIGHGPSSDPKGWVDGRWSVRAGWGSCHRFRKCQAAGPEAALLPLCPPGCRLPGTELSTWGPR